MSIFAQDIDSAVWQSMVDCGSSFHNEILQAVSDNLYGSYDGQTLKVWSKNGMGNYVVSINEHEDLFRNYLPSLSCIQSQNMLLKVYQTNLDGKNMLVETPAFSFYGKTLSNIRIKTSRSVPGSWMDVEFIENISIDIPLIQFCSSVGIINHKLGTHIPEAGKNVNISNDCNIRMESQHDWGVFVEILKVIDRRGFSRLQNLDSLSTWEDLSQAIHGQMYQFSALPVLRGVKVSKMLDLPKYLKNKAHYIISFPKGSTSSNIFVHFIKHSDKLSKFHLCDPDETYTAEVNYLTEDGYYICY